MKQYAITVEPKLVREVDEIVKDEGFYSSRNDFVRDAIRSKVLELRKLKIRGALKEVGKKALERGWNGEMPSKKEREKITRDFLKEKGFSLD